MESKDLQINTSSLRSRVKCEPLQIDPSKPSDSDSILLPGSSASSYSASTKSPITPADTDDDHHSSTTEAAPDSPDVEVTREPASGPQRARGSSTSSTKAGDFKEKRKRSRVTPEQLAHLERFFAADRSPTAIRRREISDILGMQERQTQIWFQNRRAKAKLLDGKKHRGSAGDWSETTPPDTPPQLSPGFEADLHSLIHEDEPVTIVPCSDLSIGTWRRIATSSSKHDLVAYFCDAKHCLTWFIHSAGYGFKMEIPYDTITHTDFRNANPGQGLASFTLSQPPTFYLEQLPSPRDGFNAGKTWKKCSDWTEGMQATKILRHELIGSAVHLAHFLSELRDNRSSSDIQLLTPPLYHVDEEHAPPSMQIPHPPFAGLRNDGFLSHRPDYLNHGRKRSFSGPPSYATPSSFASHDFSLGGDRSVQHEGPTSAHYSTSTFAQTSDRFGSLSFSHTYGQRPGPGYSPTEMQPSQRPQPSTTDFSNVPISHAVAPRTFANHSPFMFDQGRDSPSFQLEVMHRPSAPPSTHSHFASPSPPLPTTPFNPQGEASLIGSTGYRPAHVMHQPAPHPSDSSSSIITGLPALPYTTHEVHHGHNLVPNRSNSLVGALGNSSSPPSDMHIPSPVD